MSHREEIRTDKRRVGAKGAIFRVRSPQSLKKYGLTQAEYEAMEDAIDGMCPICFASSKLVVDHCHETGSVRGLICNKCNVGLGLLRESSHVLIRATQYLDDSRAAA